MGASEDKEGWNGSLAQFNSAPASTLSMWTLLFYLVQVWSSCGLVELVQGGCTNSGRELMEKVNAFRNRRGLPSFRISDCLCDVARWHVMDLNTNWRARRGDLGHNWSNLLTPGTTTIPWRPCSLQASGSCMWDKPRELTNYKGDGYENMCRWWKMSADRALSCWQRSTPHMDVILNRGPWRQEWKAVGAEWNGEFASMWFGREYDVGSCQPK